MARGSRELQSLLDICSEWASSHGMAWAAGKCTALLPQETRKDSVTIAGQQLTKAGNAEYLGMTISIKSTSQPAKRAATGWARFRELKCMGIHQGGLSTRTAVRLYKTFVRPTFEFGLHLSTKLDLMARRLGSLEKAVIQAILPQLGQNSRERARAAPAWLPARGDVQTPLTMEASPQTKTSKKIERIGCKDSYEKWLIHWKTKLGKYRSAAYPSKSTVQYASPHSYRASAPDISALMFFGRFPGDPYKVVSRYGDQGILHMRQLNSVLLKQRWNKNDYKHLKKALDGLTVHWPRPTSRYTGRMRTI
eukprot:IDg5289t1